MRPPGPRSKAATRTSHSSGAGASHARLAPEDVAVEGTHEVVAGVMVDLDADGDVAGTEALNASSRGPDAAPVADKPGADKPGADKPGAE